MSEAPSPIPAPTRLRAHTRRVPRRSSAPSLAGGEEDDFPEEASREPNMRLSRALWVMLLLHVVAIGGVFAFGKIKEGPAKNRDEVRPGARGAAREVPRPEVSGAPEVPTDNAPTPFPSAPPPRNPAAAAPPARTTPTPTLSRVEADAVRLIESGGPNPPGPGERSYVVGRGETVQHIAQKLRVEPAALLRLNNIDDPRKIQVGQRLRVPPPPVARSRS